MHSGKYFNLTIFIFIFFASRSIAQDTLNTALVDKKSYQLYLDNNWDELIKYGSSAVEKGYDYFYLQMRIGTAWFEKKNYRVAENHFISALNFNSGDELAREYLYYCYVFGGKYDEARVLSKTFGKELENKTGTDSMSSLNFVMLEGGIKNTDSTNLFKNAAYFQIGLSHYLKRRVSLFHAITYFNQKDFRGQIIQFQYYLKTNIPLKSKWSLSPAVHWINIDYTPNFTAQKKPPPGMGPPPKPKPPTSTKTNYFVGSIGINKSISHFDLSLGTTVSNIDSSNQYIHSLGLTYFPFGNPRFSLTGTYYLHTENIYSSFNSAFSASISVSPVKRLSLAINYFNNTKNNIIESNGFSVNNSFGLTPSRYSLLANVSLGKHLGIYGMYLIENKEEPLLKFNYYYNFVILGLKFIP